MQPKHEPKWQTDVARRLCQDIPRPVLAQDLDEFDREPHRALLNASAGGSETVVYAVVPDDLGGVKAAGVAVVVPFARYLELVRPAEQPEKAEA